MLKKWGEGYGLDWSGSGELQVASSSVGANEPSASRSALFYVFRNKLRNNPEESRSQLHGSGNLISRNLRVA
jgi:hypothetical protein